MTNWIATPADEGFHAYQNDALECECPYPPDTDESVKWREGWRRARLKFDPFAGTTFETRAEREARIARGR